MFMKTQVGEDKVDHVETNGLTKTTDEWSHIYIDQLSIIIWNK